MLVQNDEGFSRYSYKSDNPARSIIYLLGGWRASVHLTTSQFQQWHRQNVFTIEDIYALIHAGFDIEVIGPLGLEESTRKKKESIYWCGMLIDAGVPVDAYGPDGLSALQIAAGKEEDVHDAQSFNKPPWDSLVYYLLDRGANINLPASDDGGRTALQNAAESSRFGRVGYLIDAGADVKAPPAKNRGLTALEAAAKPENYMRLREGKSATPKVYIGMFKKLLDLGAPVKRADGSSAILLNALIQSYWHREERHGCLELVLDAGANPNGRSAEDTRNWLGETEENLVMCTPLQSAARNLDPSAVSALLRHGADINAPAYSYHGYTALQGVAGAELKKLRYTNARRHGEKQILITNNLLRGFADVNAPAADEFGRTTLQAAILNENYNHALVTLLLNNNADINAPPAAKGGVTALQAAAIRGNVPVAKLLISKGANVNAPGSLEEGRTALEGAAEHGRLDMVQMLLANGAMPDPVVGFSRATELAISESHFHIADLLDHYWTSHIFNDLMH
ncbi:unnamed protein product [Clonostachys rosea]|uniref:Uncharacterized protein n=1 Tax=Bionectria ochroleuca TaxID=29856 RepID=A0ABY6UF53_BIOOC|nr:unnamed protein product [Clonostachys rosea]